MEEQKTFWKKISSNKTRMREKSVFRERVKIF